MRPKLNFFLLKCKTNTSQRPEGTISLVKYGCCDIGCFSSAVTGKLVKNNGKTDGEKHKAVMGENLEEATKDFRNEGYNGMGKIKAFLPEGVDQSKCKPKSNREYVARLKNYTMKRGTVLSRNV